MYHRSLECVDRWCKSSFEPRWDNVRILSSEGFTIKDSYTSCKSKLSPKGMKSECCPWSVMVVAQCSTTFCLLLHSVLVHGHMMLKKHSGSCTFVLNIHMYRRCLKNFRRTYLLGSFIQTFVLTQSEDEREMCTRTVYCTNIDKKVKSKFRPFS